MRRLVVSCGVLSLVVLLHVSPVPALTDGQADGGAHPAVGFIMGTKGDPCQYLNQFVGRSGVLIDSDVFLTTGEAADAFASSIVDGFIDEAWVIMDSQPFVVGAPEPDTFDCNKMIPLTSIVANPTWSSGGADVGVLILATPQSITPATLPTLNRLKKIKKSPLTVVTYSPLTDPNLEATLTQRSGTAKTGNPVHLELPTHTVVIDPATPPNPNPCVGFYSQGGATYVGSTNELISLVRWDTAPTCSTTNHHQRLDVQAARDFLDDYVTLP